MLLRHDLPLSQALGTTTRILRGRQQRILVAYWVCKSRYSCIQPSHGIEGALQCVMVMGKKL